MEGGVNTAIRTPLDQEWHAFWLLVMALIITGGSR